MKMLCTLLLAGLASLSFVSADPPDVPPPPAVPCCGNRAVEPPNFTLAFDKAAKPEVKKKHPRGRKVDPVKVKARHVEAFMRHGRRMKNLSKTTVASFDCRTAFGNVLPADDQGQCGDCFGVSSADGCSMALVKAGYGGGKADGSFRLSSQYGLDYGAFQGGCDGGDEAQVIDYIKTTGFPLTSDYGPYTASPGPKKNVTGMTFYKIADWGYCTPSQEEGIASPEDIKNAMIRYGPISVAFDASACDSYTWPAIMKGAGNSVDHAVLCIGWDDSKNAFLGMNQWGDWGGPQDTFWIDYSSYSLGTEAIWISATALPPPPPPPGPVPPPPGPTPPPPGPAPAGTTTFSVAGPQIVGGSLTLEGVPVGTNAAIATLAAIAQPPPPPPPAPPQPIPVQAQIDALKAQADADHAILVQLLAEVKTLTKAIGGK